jgi:uncharacterized protein
MNDREYWWLRIGLLCELVERAPSKLGRTAVMKLAYFLQTLQRVPLGYDFRLYTYGPFDDDVLGDLGQAESMRAVKSALVQYPGGYGYEFSAGRKSEEVKAFAGPDLAKYRDAITWVLGEFGGKSAAELELLSTIVYADREASREGRSLSLAELSHQVRQIKPRFSEEHIMEEANSLVEKGLLSPR